MKEYVYSAEFNEREDKKAFVDLCEKKFESQIEKAAEAVLRSGKKVITLYGPTCSGKTTTAENMIRLLEEHGKKVGIISIDDFFFPRVHIENTARKKRKRKLDYDSVDAIDLEMLGSCVELISKRKDVYLPVFDFNNQNRIGERIFQSSQYDFVIFEGIQAIYPEVVRLFEGSNISIMIWVENDVNVNGVDFSSREIRLMRRLVRDEKFRSLPPDGVFEMWESVSENEDKNILPYEKNCDVRVDSFMAYEPFMLKNAIYKLFEDHPVCEEYKIIADGLTERLSKLPGLEKELLPDGSVYHEFLG